MFANKSWYCLFVCFAVKGQADLILAEMDTGYIKRVLFSDLGSPLSNPREKLESIYDDDEIAAYCIPKVEEEAVSERQAVNVVVYQRKVFNPQAANPQWFPFGLPLMFVCKNTAEDITEKLNKYVTSLLCDDFYQIRLNIAT